MTVGQKIIALRKKNGISQELLAEQSGVSLRTIQRIENDESSPRLYTLKTLADYFGVNVYTFTITNNEAQNSPELIPRDLALVQLINASALLVVLLPVVHLVFPFVIWARNKQQPIVYQLGKRIISFQLLWLILCLLALLLTHLAHYLLTGSTMTGRISPLLYTYSAMLLINIGLVITAAIRLKKDPPSIYASLPALF